MTGSSLNIDVVTGLPNSGVDQTAAPQSALSTSAPSAIPNTALVSSTNDANSTSISTSSSSQGTSSSVPASTTTSSPSSLNSVVPATESGNPAFLANDSASKARENGLIAGISVVSVLLLFALIALGFFFYRRRRNQPRKLDGLLGHQDDLQAMRHGTSDLSSSAADEKPLPSATPSLEATIVSLENQLHDKDIQLRENHATLLSIGRRPSSSSFSDKQAHERFNKLFAAIQRWVTHYFEGKSLMISPSSDTISTLIRSQPDYEALLKDPKETLLVLRGLVADIICQAFTTGQLLGNEAYWELRQAIDAKASPTDSNEWRALTMKLLEKTSSYHSDRAESIDEITQQIESVISDLTGSVSSQGRKSDLVRIVDMAAKLTHDTAKQRALYKVQMPTGTFDPLFMDAVVVDDSNRNSLHGKPIRAAISPSIVRWGNEKGSGYERSETIFKAQVIVLTGA